MDNCGQEKMPKTKEQGIDGEVNVDNGESGYA
jgi:hypothetical protein